MGNKTDVQVTDTRRLAQRLSAHTQISTQNYVTYWHVFEIHKHTYTINETKQSV